ncbi:hypothetical protein [Candidatus Magnetobacterium casense]|uniref:Glycosyltransferase n=1 Tax=Candidatus Magnetobacterium casense TaxID=1455061 RepID=A0ABS6RX31_9BACT|nr:hypothetical protein [Candidatus Magnetobacterium casensis]MBV6340353.1 hypothetical protein [Candidatus Magnetobacterium casensis]
MRILIAAPICEGKNYSINDWLHSVATMMRRRPKDVIDFCFGLNNSSTEYEKKLSSIELYPHGKDSKKNPIILRLPQTEKDHNIPAIVGRSREMIREYATKMNYVWILWLDTDTIPPIDALDELIKTGKPFISGVYFYKHTKQVVATWCVNKAADLCTNIPIERIQEAAMKDPPAIFQIKACGFGCVLMHHSVFKNIKFEWVLEGQSEDIRYCQRCNEAGIKIWLHPRMMCQHKSDTDYTKKG